MLTAETRTHPGGRPTNEDCVLWDPALSLMAIADGMGGHNAGEVASRLALDVRRMTFTFDSDNPADRDRIGRLYRHGRVLVHEARNGRVSIVADVPRRLAGLLEVNFS